MGFGSKKSSQPAQAPRDTPSADTYASKPAEDPISNQINNRQPTPAGAKPLLGPSASDPKQKHYLLG